jgi:hypothetical protein
VSFLVVVGVIPCLFCIQLKCLYEVCKLGLPLPCCHETHVCHPSDVFLGVGDVGGGSRAWVELHVCGRGRLRHVGQCVG